VLPVHGHLAVHHLEFGGHSLDLLPGRSEVRVGGFHFSSELGSEIRTVLDLAREALLDGLDILREPHGILGAEAPVHVDLALDILHHAGHLRDPARIILELLGIGIDLGRKFRHSLAALFPVIL